MLIIDDIIWLDRIVEKLAWKHNVLPSEVEGEHLYNALGRTQTGRYLSVFFIRKLDNRALIITARNMNRKERKKYGKK